MTNRITIGSPIDTSNVPSAFYKWFEEITDMYEFRTMEVAGGEIRVVRVRTLIASIRAVEQLKYGKIVSDSSGVFLERTFFPRYSKEKDAIILEQ